MTPTTTPVPPTPAAGSETEADRIASEAAYRAYLRDAASTAAFATPPADMQEKPGDYTDE